MLPLRFGWLFTSIKHHDNNLFTELLLNPIVRSVQATCSYTKIQLYWILCKSLFSFGMLIEKCHHWMKSYLKCQTMTDEMMSALPNKLYSACYSLMIQYVSEIFLHISLFSWGFSTRSTHSHHQFNNNWYFDQTLDQRLHMLNVWSALSWWCSHMSLD